MYRHVTMIEFRDVVRLRNEGLPGRSATLRTRPLSEKGAPPSGAVAAQAGVPLTGGALTDEHVGVLLLALQPSGPRGNGWSRCVDSYASLESTTGDGAQ